MFNKNKLNFTSPLLEYVRAHCSVDIDKLSCAEILALHQEIEEAEKVLKARECNHTGPVDYILDMGTNEPVSLSCDTCGKSWDTYKIPKRDENE